MTTKTTPSTKATPTANGLDLDALIAEGSELDPYTFTLAGHRYTTIDPKWVDYRVAMELNTQDPREVLHAYLGDEQWAQFSEQAMPVAVLRQLLEAIDEYYPDSNLGE